jgi:hypothetical protein
VTAPSALFSSIVAAIIAAPAPLPSPSSGPLKEIGHVRASVVCGNIVVHANSAISSALRNDATIVSAVNRLRTIDLESSTLSMQRGIHDLDRLAGDMRADAVHGVGEVKRLRELAEKSTDPTRKAELKAFADWLGGALYRQKKVAMDLDGFVAYLEYRDMATPDETETKMVAATNSDVASPVLTPPPYYQGIARQQTLNEMAGEAARDFASRLPDIARDESRAADHSEGAVSGC